MVVVKIEYNSDLRRVSLAESEQSFTQLASLVEKLFAQDLPERWVLKYKDEDGDMVTITCDLEFTEALHCAAKTGILKLFVVPKEGGKVETKKRSTAVEHPALCDHCDERIVGIRFKCNVCPDYDLCETCEKLGGVHDKSHCFLKIHNSFELMKLRQPGPALQQAPPKCPYLSGRCHQQQRYWSRYVKDVTIEDGTRLPAGMKFVKVWRLKNNGSAAWPEGTSLVFVGGDVLSSGDSVRVPPVAPGEEVDISVDMVAPKKPSRYISNWRLSTAEGARFGHRVWVDVAVDEVEKKEVTVIDQKEEPEKVEVAIVDRTEEPEKIDVKVDVIIEPPKEEEKPVVKEKKVDDDIPQGPIRQMLIELYDMGFTNRAQNRQVLVRSKGDLVAAVHALLNL